jgi:cytochrome c oxidase cbb3-type subunit 3
MIFHRLLGACAAAVLLAALGCKGEPELVRGGAAGEVTLPAKGDLAQIPLGDFAGRTPNMIATGVVNPYANSSGATTEGGQLFQQMNCADCHGYDARGGMGPDLTDAYWRYGGSPAEIYKSIYEGRPKGMPAWGAALPPQQIWKLAAYIQSLGGAFPARLAEAGRQGNLGGLDSTELRSMKGVQDEH